MSRSVLLAALVTAAVCAASAPAAMAPGASVSLSTHRAGAQSVGLSIRIPMLLQCGVPRGGTIEITVPGTGTVPGTLRAAAVRVDGKPVAAVHVSHQTLTVGVASGGVTCDSLTKGTAVVSIARTAGIANPARAGTYTYRVARGGSSYRVPVSIVS